MMTPLNPDILAKLRTSFYGEGGIKGTFDPREADVYIPSDIEEQGSKKATKTTGNLLQELPTSKHRSFLVLGDSGLGKTTLSKWLCHYFWQHLSTHQRIPLYIHLPQVAKEALETKLLDFYLEDICNLSKEELREIKNKSLLLFLDGYDEIGIKEDLNLYKSNQWERYDIQILTSCRPEVLQRFNKAALFEVPNVSVTGPKYLALELQRFDQAHIEQYLAKFVQHMPLPLQEVLAAGHITAEWKEAATYLRWLKHFPVLWEFVQTPFLLSLAAQVLPVVFSKTQDETEIAKILSSRNAVFEQFVQQWFEYQAKRLQKDGYLRTISEQELVGYLQAYAVNLAGALLGADGYLNERLLEDRETLRPDFAEPVHNPELMLHYLQRGKELFSTKENIKHLRSGCLLSTQGGKFKFLHKTLVEYFAARDLFNGLQGEYELYLQDTLKEHHHPKLNRELIQDLGVLQVLVERVQTDEEFKGLLCDIVLATKKIGALQKAAANAMTILNRARVNFSGLDFRDIQIPGADLRNALCYGTDFRGANVEGVFMQEALLGQAQFQGAFCKDLEFGEIPYLSLPSPVKQVVFYPTVKEETCLIGCRDGRIYQYSIKTGKLLNQFDHKSEGLECIAVHAGTQRMASSKGEDGIIWLWSLNSNKKPNKFRGTTTGWVRSIAFAGDGEWLVSGGDDNAVRLWHMPDGVPGPVLQGHTEWVLSVAFDNSGKWLASGSNDHTVRLWHLLKKTSQVLCGHTSGVNSIAFDNSGKWLASGSNDHTVRLWSLPEGTPGPVLKRHAHMVNSVAFDNRGQWLASGGNDSTVCLWSLPDGVLGFVLERGNSRGNSVVFDKSGQWLAADNYNTVHLWYLRDRLGSALHKHTWPVINAVFDRRGQWMASASKNYTVRLWHLPERRPGPVLQGHTGLVESIAFDSKGQWLASGGADMMVCLWHLPERRTGPVLRHTGWVKGIAFEHSGEWLASADEQHMVYLWHLPDGTQKRVLQANSCFIKSITFDRSGQWLALGDITTVLLWHLPDETPKPVVLEGHTYPVTSIAFDRNSQWLASGGNDSTIRLWCLPKGELKFVLRGHTSEVGSIAFNSSGQWLASAGSWDKTVRLWDVAKGTCLQVQPLWYTINSLTFSEHDPSELLVAGEGGNVYCFQVSISFAWGLLWGTNPSLVLTQANISQTIGLSKVNQRLCKQRGAQGKVACVAQTYEPWYALCKPILGTVGYRYSLLQGNPCLMVTENIWVVSVVRRQNKKTGLFSWFSWDGGAQHTFLVIEGSQQYRRFLIKADLTVPNKKNVVIRLDPLDNIQRFSESVKHYEAQQWNISKTVGIQLLKNIRADQQELIRYSIGGSSSWFVPNLQERYHNCVSWCKEQLKNISIVLPERWYHFLIVLPSDITAPTASAASGASSSSNVQLGESSRTYLPGYGATSSSSTVSGNNQERLSNSGAFARPSF